MTEPSTRARLLQRRTYNRPLDKEGKVFETWEETINRVIGHQRWLWERAKGKELNHDELIELVDLRALMLDRKVLVSGRTLWLGGTDVAKSREASQFNCSFTHVETISDVVDCLWLLLQGCGVGFKPIVGTLNGFTKPLKVEVIRSTRTEKGGEECNYESYDERTGTWRISVGDSAKAWAKSVGKLLAGKYPAKTLVLDLSNIRPAGERLSGYGWISSGDAAIAKAYTAIAAILNRRAGQLLTRIDILDVVNLLGTILSSRRSAEICLFDYGCPEWEDFTLAKKDFWVKNPHRSQSNNSLIFWQKPTKEALTKIMDLIIKGGGSEPGFINGQAAQRRAPWFAGVNPCAEILLGNKSFCNLTEVDVAKFANDYGGLVHSVYLVARANYRQTLVNLSDDILQPMWHHNNEYLRLCGVGLTGLARRPDLTAYDFKSLRNASIAGCYSMADELGFQRPKNVTTVKPSGTLSKVMDTTEGIHRPLGRFIFNNIQFSRHDNVVPLLREANYRVFDHPSDTESVLVTFPVEWSDIPFTKVDGKEVNLDSAIVQLERYRLLMDNYCEQNCSVTISYDPSEKEAIVDWIYTNWDSYVGVSFIYRNDPTKTAKDLGYIYLPQEVVTKDVFDAYSATLKPVDLDKGNSLEEMMEKECVGGVCPVR